MFAQFQHDGALERDEEGVHCTWLGCSVVGAVVLMDGSLYFYKYPSPAALNYSNYK